MKVEFAFNRKDFIDMIKKMAVPSHYSKEGFLYPIIYPMVIPVIVEGKRNDAMFEWIVRSELTTWVRTYYERYTELTEPIRIPINAENTLKVLNIFNKKDYVFFIHDSDRGIQTITDGVCDNSSRVDMPISGEEPGPKVYKAYPGKIEKETEIILFKDGTIKPDISGSCDVNFLKELFDATKKLSSEEKEHFIVYNFIINEDLHTIEAYTDKENIKTGNVITKTSKVSDIIGHGELHYHDILEDVVGVLSSDPFKFHTINRGPMWIMQDTAKTKVRYLVPPAAEGTYKQILQNQDEIIKLESKVTG